MKLHKLALFLIGLFFGTGLGFVVASTTGGMQTPAHDHAGHSDMAHDNSALTPWVGPPPDLQMALLPDMGADLNLHIMADGFTFAPEQVNGAPVPGSGHAHVYIDGVKYARVYGPWLHLKDVPAGADVRVTLNANDHSEWGIDGQPIAIAATAP